MAMNCSIVTNRYPWSVKGKIHVCGFIWNNDVYTDSFSFIAFTEAHSDNFEEFQEWCTGLNGQFSIIVEKSDEVWMATSHIWIFPLFYTHNDHSILVTDDPDQCLANHRFELSDQGIILHFLHFCATPGGTTLEKTISQLRPGEIRRISPSGNVPGSITGTWKNETREPASSEELKTLFYNVFSRYIQLFGKRQILLPLTSGYDSRLLACMLKEFGYENVICATWGRESMPERITAEKVARKLGFRYIFIPYDKKLTGDFEKDPVILDFMHYCGHYSSMPFLQDYFAIRKLITEGTISPQTIAIPGFSGDFIRGSHLYHELFTQDDPEIANEIIRKFGTSYVQGKDEKQKLVRTMLRYHFNELSHLPNTLKYELWDYMERQCKFIGNSSQVYQYFGIQNYALLQDRDLVRFFLSLPTSQRMGALLYNETLEKLIFRQAGVDFDLKKAESTSRKYSSLKEAIIEKVPAFLRNIYYPLDDDVYYREITGKLRKSDERMVFRDPVKPHFYNCYMTQWYLQRICIQQKILYIQKT